MKLNQLYNIPGSVSNRKRVGRGIASGTGKTCGRGHKGQKSRSGVAIKTEGGQMPLIKRLPKRGFVSLNKNKFKLISLDHISKFIDEKKIDSKKIIDKEVLFKVGLISKTSQPAKLLAGNNALDHAVEISIDFYSQSAKNKIIEAKGKIS